MLSTIIAVALYVLGGLGIAIYADEANISLNKVRTWAVIAVWPVAVFASFAAAGIELATRKN